MLLLLILVRFAVKKLKVERSEDANAGKFKAIMEKGMYIHVYVIDSMQWNRTFNQRGHQNFV